MGWEQLLTQAPDAPVQHAERSRRGGRSCRLDPPPEAREDGDHHAGGLGSSLGPRADTARDLKADLVLFLDWGVFPLPWVMSVSLLESVKKLLEKKEKADVHRDAIK